MSLYKYYFPFFCLWLMTPQTIQAQSTSSLLRQASHTIKRGEQLAQQSKFPQAVQRFQQALPFIRKALTNSSSPQNKKKAQKLLQKCLCNAGYYAEQGQQLLKARNLYRQCLTTRLSPHFEKRVKKALVRIKQALLRFMATVTIRTNPSNAKVQFLQQGSSGILDRSPLTRQMEPGTYTLTIQAPGYQSYRTKLTIHKSARIQRFYRLKKLGLLKIQTQPARAQIQISGPNGLTRTVGSPFRMMLPQGAYKIVIRKAGYKEYHQTVAIYSGKSFSKKIQLLRQSTTLLVETTPLQAQVKLKDAQGKKFSGTTPFRAQISAGQLSLSIYKRGYKPIAQKVVALAGTRLEKRYILTVHVPPKQQLARTLAWSSTALTVATAGTGLVLMILAQKNFATVKLMRGRIETSNEEINALNNSGSTMQTAGIVFASAAAVPLIAAIALFVWDGGRSKAPPPIALIPPQRKNQRNSSQNQPNLTLYSTQ